MLKTWHLCADATYKLIWQSFPVLISGTIDLQRHFHPVSESIYSNEAVDDFTFIFFMFFQRWSQLNESNINNFLEYFRKEWVDSFNNGWYEGICYRVLSTNNGLEANNGAV